MRSLRLLLIRCALCLCGAVPALLPATAAGEFAITPLRVHLDRADRAAEVAIRNDGDEPLRMQIDARTWSQDADGKDQYTPAEGLTYFPRVLEVPPRASRLVRVGVRAAPVAREETYRLFIERLPAPGPQEPLPGATLRVVLRIGVPVFVAPLEPQRKAEIAELAVKSGRVSWRMSNLGNVHFAIDRGELLVVGRGGEQLLVRELQERYYLAGTSRLLQSDLPPEVCTQAASVEVSLTGAGLDLRRKVDVEPGACR